MIAHFGSFYSNVTFNVTPLSLFPKLSIQANFLILLNILTLHACTSISLKGQDPGNYSI